MLVAATMPRTARCWSKMIHGKTSKGGVGLLAAKPAIVDCICRLSRVHAYHRQGN